MRKWYEEGLLEPEFPTVIKAADLEARAFSGDWGMWYYNVGPIEKATSEGRKKVPDYTLGGIKPITLKKGDKNRFVRFQSPVGGGGITIPAGTRRADIITSFFDLGYDQGEIGRLYSLGIEGTSYILENPATAAITDNIIHNTYGIAMTDALYRYCRGMNGGPFRIDPLFYTAYWSMPEQRDALAKWSTDLEVTFANDPAIYGIMTAEEVERVSILEVQMQTYIDEMFIKFVTGRESLNYFDTYLGELKKLGMDNVLAVQQAVNDRYHASVK
jgi:putative aldouronate transport system substrate-binding protein